MHLKVHDGSNSEPVGRHRKINYLRDKRKLSSACPQENANGASVGMWSLVQNGGAFGRTVRLSWSKQNSCLTRINRHVSMPCLSPGVFRQILELKVPVLLGNRGLFMI